MAALGGALLSSVLEKSPAEKALTPWWDKIQDYIIYGLIIVGKQIFLKQVFIEVVMILEKDFIIMLFSASIAIPSTLALGTSLDCTPCTDKLCPGIEFEDGKDIGYSFWWAKKYCTYDSGDVDSVLLFFPLIILMAPAIIYLSEISFQVI